jgi:hypothetical protein
MPQIMEANFQLRILQGSSPRRSPRFNRSGGVNLGNCGILAINPGILARRKDILVGFNYWEATGPANKSDVGDAV